MKLKVLVWPCTTEVGREVIRALQDDKDTELVLASSERPLEHYYIDPVTVGGWVESLRSVCQQAQVTHVYPCHDAVLRALAVLRLHANLAEDDPLRTVTYVMPPSTAVLTCDSKLDTYQALRETVDLVEVPRWLYRTNGKRAVDLRSPEDRRQPLFVKPDAGNASRGCTVLWPEDCGTHVEERAVVNARQHSRNGLALLSEYLPGPEYTVDCFSTWNRSQESVLEWSQVRERIRTGGGISTYTERLSGPWVRDLHEDLEMVGLELRMRGAWFVQVKYRVDGTPVLLEVGARIAGGSALARVNGVNLPLLSVYETLGIPLTVSDTRAVRALRRPLTNEYQLDFKWGTLAMDLDDTLIRDGKVNPRMVALLYAARNAGKRIMLTTRSSVEDTNRKLHEAHVDPELFNFRVHVPPERSKTMGLFPNNTVLVDDSFIERQRVAEAGFKTFDASGAECLWSAL